jgi:hypothetical protein
MDDQRADVADVGQMAGEPHRIDETCAGVTTTADAEREHRARTVGQVGRGTLVVRVRREAGPPHVLDAGVVGQPLGHPGGVGDVGRHALRQGVDALQQLERRLRGEARAEVAQLFAAHLGQEAELAEVAPPIQPAIGRYRRRHLRESPRAPIESA